MNVGIVSAGRGPIEVYSNCLMPTFGGLFRPGSDATDPAEMRHLAAVLRVERTSDDPAGDLR